MPNTSRTAYLLQCKGEDLYAVSHGITGGNIPRSPCTPWDAASWHASKAFVDKVEAINAQQVKPASHAPRVELALLPSGAQFLNVIESVFSGIARAVIHNSDNESVSECKRAIDRHFRERNAAFAKNPRRAGNVIWGKEREPPFFSEANNCKDPRYR